MFRLRRFYLDSCGVADNRFSNLMVDLTDMSGQPADAIVWLRNGAGKTTMLSLLLALILPDRRDFLATRTKHRYLEDLILPEEYAGRPDAVAAVTRRFTAALERLARRHPEQYFWLHRRWKHQPKARKGKQAA